jgi:hypothetical protein
MPVDNLWITRRDYTQKPVDNSQRLTRLVRFMLSRRAGVPASSQRVVKLMGVLCLSIGSLAINVQPAQANDVDMLKLYAHSRIVNWKQTHCFIAIINKENRSWNPSSRNGSHYGIGQMRSQHYRSLDSYRQIDSSIAYIKHRYGSMCNAWRFHKKHGYY